MRLTLREAQHAFMTALREGCRPPALQDIISEYDIANDHLRYCARFIEEPNEIRCYWTLDRWNIEETEGRFNPRRYEMDCRSLYSRLYEDHLIRLELAPRRAVLDDLIRLNANPALIEQYATEFHTFHAYPVNAHKR